MNAWRVIPGWSWGSVLGVCWGISAWNVEIRVGPFVLLSRGEYESFLFLCDWSSPNAVFFSGGGEFRAVREKRGHVLLYCNKTTPAHAFD